MVYLLYYNHPVETWNSKWSWIIKWASFYDVHPIAIDLTGTLRQDSTPPFCFPSLQAAYENPIFQGYTWVWLNASSETYLDEFVHPTDNVVYCVGDDMTGFQNFAGAGPSIKLRPTNKEMIDGAEWWAAMVAPQILYDRFMFLQGKRK